MKTTIPSLLGALLICLPLGYTPSTVRGREGKSANPPAAMGQPGKVAAYRHQSRAALRASVVASFTLTLGDIERSPVGERQWICLSATKANGETFRIFLLSAGYPPAIREAARPVVRRYLLQEGSSPAREYRNALTGEAVLPAMGGWKYLLPRAADNQARVLKLFPSSSATSGSATCASR